MRKWSPADQKDLDALLKLRAEFMETAREPLDALTLKFALRSGGIMDGGQMKRATDILIANADAFRDALEPFDSGIRCGREG